jgi:hypothetical protein
MFGELPIKTRMLLVLFEPELKLRFLTGRL